MTSVSLFASATVLPASSAAQVLRNPAAPTIAASTTSISGPRDELLQRLRPDQHFGPFGQAATNRRRPPQPDR